MIVYNEFSAGFLKMVVIFMLQNGVVLVPTSV